MKWMKTTTVWPPECNDMTFTNIHLFVSISFRPIQSRINSWSSLILKSTFRNRKIPETMEYSLFNQAWKHALKFLLDFPLSDYSVPNSRGYELPNRKLYKCMYRIWRPSMACQFHWWTEMKCSLFVWSIDSVKTCSFYSIRNR